jgi:hypothetical protein
MLSSKGRESKDFSAIPMNMRGIKIALAVGRCPCGVASFKGYAGV